MDERDTMGIETAEAPIDEKDGGCVVRTDFRIGQTVFFLHEKEIGDAKVFLPLQGVVEEILVVLSERRDFRRDEFFIRCPSLGGRADLLSRGRVYSGAAQAIGCAAVANDAILRPAKSAATPEELEDGLAAASAGED